MFSQEDRHSPKPVEGRTASNRRGWFKSSFSGAGSGGCVQVRFANGEARVRDSKDLQGPVLVFNRSEWEAFELGVFHGEFTFPIGE
ncbi:DUF397 domain-containing protein [Nocardia alni]|uniref:DUF397 domain-containing protein n=1 Tax=Nocardia alni TaxID=2815723 RepID=UPI001C2455F1|nr:DUF397 domain-containing protein [Nocardia alni]